METIEAGYSGSRTHEIYTRAEADDLGLAYVYWKQVDGGSEYALSDDGYVLEVYKTKVYTNKEGETRRHITFGGAAKWVGKNDKLLWEDYRRSGRYSSLNPNTSWVKVELGRTRTKQAVDVLVASFMATGNYDWKRAGQVYRPDQQIPEATLRRLFHQKEARDMLHEELKKRYEALGFDENWAIKAIMEAAEIARADGDALNLLRAADKGIELLAMKPGVTVTQTEETAEISGSVLSEARSYQARLARRSAEIASSGGSSPSLGGGVDEESESESESIAEGSDEP